MYDLNLIAISVQAVGTLLVAALLGQLPRVLPGAYLRYWSGGWVALAFALFSLLFALRVTPAVAVAGPLRTAGLIVYCLSEYLFGYLLWAGFRNFTRGKSVSLSDARLMAPFVAFGVTAPFFFPDLRSLYPLHAAVFALFFLASLVETYRVPADPANPAGVGLSLARSALMVLTVLFFHYAPVLGWAVFVADLPDDKSPAYLQLSPVMDALAELGLAFSMVVLAIERVRSELEEKNRQLAAATEQLAGAARTDALTGLLNRRGFDELVAGQLGRPFGGCVVAIDLNDLKPLNDRHGHPAGDAALQTVARALRGHFRVTDPICRTGGDEFLVVLPGSTAADAAVRMGRIDVNLLGQRLPGLPGLIDLGIAWGVAEFAAGDDLPAAVGQADAAMYAQKQARKARV